MYFSFSYRKFWAVFYFNFFLNFYNRQTVDRQTVYSPKYKQVYKEV